MLRMTEHAPIDATFGHSNADRHVEHDLHAEHDSLASHVALIGRYKFVIDHL